MYKITSILVLSFCYITAVPTQDLGRITNGAQASEGQFPYAISLQLLTGINTTTRGHRCGGVLFTFQHALTTATCVHDTVNGVTVQIAPSNYRVFAGGALLTSDTLADRIRSIANFTIATGYIGPPAKVNDIAIITLVTPFTNATVVPISLPLATFWPADFTLCNVVGWGALNAAATASTELRYSNKYIYNQNLCTSIYNSLQFRPNILTSMVCAVSYDILSSGCVGDEGNALVCEGVLTGILAETDSCATSSLPEVYTRVSNYTAWIRTISAAPSFYAPGIFLFVIISLTQFLTHI